MGPRKRAKKNTHGYEEEGRGGEAKTKKNLKWNYIKCFRFLQGLKRPSPTAYKKTNENDG